MTISRRSALAFFASTRLAVRAAPPDGPRTRPAARPAPVTACAFSPDGTSVLAARGDAVAVLSAADGSVLRALKPGLQRVTGLALRPRDGGLLAAAGGIPGESGAACLMDWKTGRPLGRGNGFADVANAVAVSPDGTTVAAGGADRAVRLFAVREHGTRLEPAGRLDGHAGPITAVTFAPDGLTVVTASTDRSMKVWDAATGRLRRTLANHTAAVRCLAVRPAPAGADALPFACASAGDDRTVRVWQPAVGRMVRIVRGHAGPVLALAYSVDGTALFSAGGEGVVRMIDADGDAVTLEWRASDDWVYAVSAAPDGKHLVIGDWSGAVKLWRLGPGGARQVW